MKQVEIRQTIKSDFMAVCNRVNDKTVKAFTVIYDGEPVAIAGVILEKDHFIVFSDVKEGLQAPKMTIWKTSRKLIEMIKSLNLPAIATTNNGKFLNSIGMEYIMETNDKEVFKI